MKFSEMPYERPDLDAVKKQYSALTERLKAAGSYEEARAVFLEKEELDKHVQTLATLSHVRHSIDTRDAFYDTEAKFWNAAEPELQEYTQAWTRAMLDGAFRAQFAAQFGELMFVNAEIELKTFSPEIIPELQQENELAQEYEKLLASAQIPFEGGVYTISQMTPFKSDPDDARRLAAWKAEGQWYKDNQGKLDGICITGGEPTLQPELPGFLEKLCELGYAIKLDTNGTYPGMLKGLLHDGILDYVAMDIKNSPQRYAEACGGVDILSEVQESVLLLLDSSIEYEFRTTVCKPLHTEKEMEEIGHWLGGAKRYFLQPFVDTGNLVSGGVQAHTQEELVRLRQAVLPDIPNTQLRGI